MYAIFAYSRRNSYGTRRQLAHCRTVVANTRGDLVVNSPYSALISQHVVRESACIVLYRHDSAVVLAGEITTRTHDKRRYEHDSCTTMYECATRLIREDLGRREFKQFKILVDTSRQCTSSADMLRHLYDFSDIRRHLHDIPPTWGEL